jgi:hypothetical protein
MSGILIVEAAKFDRPVAAPDGAPTQFKPGKTDAPVAVTVARATLTCPLDGAEAGTVS